MIQLNEFPVVGRVISHKFCSTIYVTNYEKCSVNFLEFVSKLSFVVNTIDSYPDLLCVISNDNLDEFVAKLVRISSFCRIEQMELK